MNYSFLFNLINHSYFFILRIDEEKTAHRHQKRSPEMNRPSTLGLLRQCKPNLL